MTLPQAQSSIRAVGKKELIKHLQGGRLTMRQRLLAKCFECMGGYADGTQDCRITDCPLYPVMPYRGRTNGKATPCSPIPLNHEGTASGGVTAA